MKKIDVNAGKPVVLNYEDFKKLRNRGKPFVVDVWASWCGPCEEMDPIIKELAKEHQGKVVYGKLNCDRYGKKLSEEFDFEGIPLFMIFKGGKLVDKFEGGRDKNTFKKRVEKNL